MRRPNRDYPSYGGRSSYAYHKTPSYRQKHYRKPYYVPAAKQGSTPADPVPFAPESTPQSDKIALLFATSEEGLGPEPVSATPELKAETGDFEMKVSRLKKELEESTQISHNFAKLLSYLEQELVTEKRKRKEAEDRMFDLLFNEKKTKKEDAFVCDAEGKPQYSAYAHLVENTRSKDELLDLANQELQDKQALIRKILPQCIKHVQNSSDFTPEEKGYLRSFFKYGN